MYCNEAYVAKLRDAEMKNYKEFIIALTKKNLATLLVALELKYIIMSSHFLNSIRI